MINMPNTKGLASPPTRIKALKRVLMIPKDVALIRERESLTYQGLADLLCVSKTEVYHWEQGNRMPKEPVVCFTIMYWADQLRNSAS